MPSEGSGGTVGSTARAAAAAQIFVLDVGSPVPDESARHHLARVLRLRPGELVVVADGAGGWRLCRYAAGRPGREIPSGNVLEPAGPVESELRPVHPLTVAFALAKGDRPAWVVQKLTELGVDRLVPLATERSVVRWRQDRAGEALLRLRRVALEAAAQSRRVFVPEVTPVRSVADLVTMTAPATPALAQLGGPPPRVGCWTIAVGPEGGWGRTELDLGLPTIGLSANVLRSETAAVAAGVALGSLRDAAVCAGGDGESGPERRLVREGKAPR